MESVQKNMTQRPHPVRASYQELYQEIIADADVAAFITQYHMSPDQIARSVSKFYEYVTERDKFLQADETYIATGYRPLLIMNEGYADVSYQETPELVEYRRAEAIRDRINLISLPAHLRHVTAQDLNFADENRQEIYGLILDVVKNAKGSAKGFYIYGNFGIGKSYLMAYLAHQLSSLHQLSTTMLHYPTFVVDIKNAIRDASVKEKVDDIKTAQVLVLDDIGAEQHSSWVRDDILQVILQYRMQENLLTFFTSNFSFADLERHFAAGKTGDETWQARRVMERIRFLAQEVHLEGENRRHE